MLSAYALAGPELGQVDPHQQQTLYTCSAASLLAVLKHWNYESDEPTLSRLIGAEPEIGATTMQIVMAARQLGFDAATMQFASIDELKTYTDRDIPVILNVLSFYRPGQGHFVVATKVDDTSVTLMDPNAPSNRRVLTRAALDRKWVGRSRTGVIVVPRKASSALGQAPSDEEKAAGGWAVAAAVVLTAATIAVPVWFLWSIRRGGRSRSSTARAAAL